MTNSQSSTGSGSASPNPAPVAVLAVHGAADRQPYTSVKAIANLLLNLNRKGTNRYSPYDEIAVRVPVRPVLIAQPEDPAAGFPPRRSPFDERPKNLRTYHLQKKRGTAPEDITPDYLFMKDQLSQYKGEGPGAAYETLRLEGMRISSPPDQRGLRVHIYEMYWSDLSRVKAGVFRFLGELYQLLFHLGSLGRHAVGLASSAHGGSRRWESFEAVHAWAARFLTLPIPIFNLFLLAVLMIVLPGNLPAQLRPWVAWSVVILGLIAATGYYVFRFTPQLRWWQWALLLPLVPLAGLGLLAGIARLLGRWHAFGYHHLLALEWCALAAVVLGVIIRIYNERRPGTALFAIPAGALLGLFLVAQILMREDDDCRIAQAALGTSEIIYLALNISWALLIIFSLASWIAGAIAVRETADGYERNMARRVAWTARLTLAVPSYLSLVITIALWSAVYKSCVKLFPVMYYTPLRKNYWSFDTTVPLEARIFLWNLVVDAGTKAFAALLAFLGVVIVLIVWALLPFIWAEIRPSARMNRFSASYGVWLNRGFILLRAAGELIFAAVMLVLPAVILAGQLRLFDRFRAIRWSHGLVVFFDNFTLSAQVLLTAGTLIVGSAVGLLALRGKLDVLALRFRPLLDVMLDVSNHLRMYPRSSTPRARISARYVSLLRYLCNWRDPISKTGYRSIVIVAHSQGSAITADLLRFLQKEADPALARLGNEIPVYLFTMGCPLRQLYSLRFPHLYEWARHFDSTHWRVPQPIPQDQKPAPKELGVNVWINAYRSGDYVGRYLWRADKCDYHWDYSPPNGKKGGGWEEGLSALTVSSDEAGTRREFCIGSGAHTHYWDGTASLIAMQLDAIIAEASGAPGR